MIRAMTLTLTLLLFAFLAVPSASAVVEEAESALCVSGTTICVQDGPPGCHDFCGFVCVDGTCVVCVGDPSSTGSDIRCLL